MHSDCQGGGGHTTTHRHRRTADAAAITSDTFLFPGLKTFLMLSIIIHTQSLKINLKLLLSVHLLSSYPALLRGSLFPRFVPREFGGNQCSGALSPGGGGDCLRGGA